MVFYFIAQSGLVLHKRIQTNFYIYTIPEIRRGEVIAEVERATLGPAGLEYSKEFLEDLTKWDEQGQRLIYQ